MTLYEIVNTMNSPSMRDLALVGKAYAFAEKVHRHHKRYSGEAYFNHLCETAKLIAELGADAPTVAAGLLHDTIEDVNVKPETIREQFGNDVFMLVEGVTKLGHLRYSGTNRYSESMRRMFIASSKDLRVLIVKLCDRLHNMRTLQHVPKQKQTRIAKETLDIYAPIAYRLGIRKINRELEELAFPFAYPEEFNRVKKLVSERKRELLKKIEKFHRSLLRGLTREKIAVLHAEERLKGPYSLYAKLKSRDWDFEKIYDMLAIRILVKSVEDCYRALGSIHGIWRPLPGRIKDYIAFPKLNGYRSLHTTVFTGDGSIVEIQIRTEEMHRESEYGVALHADYKRVEKQQPNGRRKKHMYSSLISWKKTGGKGKGKLRIEDTGNGIPTWIRELGDFDSAMDEREFWESLREDFFKNRIFIFTPKGDVIDLPTDSSPIDFAYAIHSDIGHHLVGVKINGKLVAIDTPLHNGDIVEIFTKGSAKPSQKWLEFAKTTMAKRHIRNTLQKLGNTKTRN